LTEQGIEAEKVKRRVRERERERGKQEKEIHPKTEYRVGTTIDGFHSIEFEIDEDVQEIFVISRTTNVEIMNTEDNHVGGCVCSKDCLIITRWIVRITKH
jgi:hypothetical protein